MEQWNEIRHKVLVEKVSKRQIRRDYRIGPGRAGASAAAGAAEVSVAEAPRMAVMRVALEARAGVFTPIAVAIS